MDIARLPKWAQDHIRDLERERDTAIRALNEYVDRQTPSPFYSDEMESLGEVKGASVKRHYFQAHRITVSHAGIELEVNIHDPEDIKLRWGTPRHSMGEVALIPVSFQQARLKTKENMRS